MTKLILPTDPESILPPKQAAGVLQTRRRFIKTATATGMALSAPNLLLAQQSGCDILGSLQADALADAQDAGPWSITLDPLAVANARQRAADLRQKIDSLSGVVDGKRREQLLQYVDALGSSVLVLSGFFIGIGPALIAGVAFGGTMLLLKAVTAPNDVNQKDILLNYASSRAPEYMELAGQGAGVVSKKAAQYGSVAGHVAGAGFALYSFYEFGQITASFQASTAELGRLRDDLVPIEAALAELEDLQILLQMRRDCAAAAAEDLSPGQFGCIYNPT